MTALTKPTTFYKFRCETCGAVILWSEEQLQAEFNPQSCPDCGGDELALFGERYCLPEHV